MYIFFIIIAIIGAIFLISAVLLQRSKKEGGLDPLASSNQIMGLSKTTDILEKTTWVLGFLIAFCAVATTFSLKKDSKKHFALNSPNIKAAQKRALLNIENNKNQNPQKETQKNE